MHEIQGETKKERINVLLLALIWHTEVKSMALDQAFRVPDVMQGTYT